MAKRRERTYQPVTVPFAATPAGEPPSIKDWANPCVWTERMLNTLETGVRGGKWHTLIDKVYAPNNLFAATCHVVGNRGAAGVDHQTVEDFAAKAPEEEARLHDALRDETYQPQAVRRVWTVFRNLDGWIRGRLRSILRKRQKRRGRARGTDHQRWPNAYFDGLGLYSLNAAHARFVQSSQR